MLAEAAAVMICSTLFIGMGLSGEIQRVLRISWRLLNCPKCLAWWSCLAVLLAGRHPLLPSLAASFLCSYAAMWLTLALDALTVYYNKMYEKITETQDTPEGGDRKDAAAGADRVETPPDDEVS